MRGPRTRSSRSSNAGSSSPAQQQNPNLDSDSSEVMPPPSSSPPHENMGDYHFSSPPEPTNHGAFSELDMSSPLCYGTPSSHSTTGRSVGRGTPIRQRHDIQNERRTRQVNVGAENKVLNCRHSAARKNICICAHDGAHVPTELLTCSEVKPNSPPCMLSLKDYSKNRRVDGTQSRQDLQPQLLLVSCQYRQDLKIQQIFLFAKLAENSIAWLYN
ncbi:hypothetical protein TNCV_424451 [Trichonephila clavipes]|nr:hypothetical protein TNCV_424451 [Trichonephila clavipes]